MLLKTLTVAASAAMLALAPVGVAHADDVVDLDLNPVTDWDPKSGLGMCYTFSDLVELGNYKVDLRAAGAQKDPLGPALVLNKTASGSGRGSATACTAAGLSHAEGAAEYVAVVSIFQNGRYVPFAVDDNTCTQNYLPSSSIIICYKS